MALLPTKPENLKIGDLFNFGLQLIDLLATLAGIAAVIAIILGGIQLVTSGGSEERAKTGKSTVIYAVIGLVVVVLAKVIVAQSLKLIEARCPQINAPAGPQGQISRICETPAGNQP